LIATISFMPTCWGRTATQSIPVEENLALERIVDGDLAPVILVDFPQFTATDTVAARHAGSRPGRVPHGRRPGPRSSCVRYVTPAARRGRLRRARLSAMDRNAPSRKQSSPCVRF
jgi:hypothetical protein